MIRYEIRSTFYIPDEPSLFYILVIKESKDISGYGYIGYNKNNKSGFVSTLLYSPNISTLILTYNSYREAISALKKYNSNIKFIKEFEYLNRKAYLYLDKNTLYKDLKKNLRERFTKYAFISKKDRERQNQRRQRQHAIR